MRKEAQGRGGEEAGTHPMSHTGMATLGSAAHMVTVSTSPATGARVPRPGGGTTQATPQCPEAEAPVEFTHDAGPSVVGPTSSSPAWKSG